MDSATGAHDVWAGAGALTPSNTVMVLISFEGPDAYACTGSLGIRALLLARALDEMGFQTHQFFIGDPKLPGH